VPGKAANTNTIFSAEGDASVRTVRHTKTSRDDGIVLALCAAYAAFCVIVRPPGPLTAPDSAGYLAFEPIHALGYPLFLKLLGAQAAMLVQPLIFCLALVWLGLESRRLSSSAALAAGAVLAPLTTPDLTRYHFTVLTESLFISGTVALIAAIVRFTRQPSWRAAAAAAAIVGVTATVRRTGIALAPVPVVMVAIFWCRLAAYRWTVLTAAIVPVVAIIGAERLAAVIVHGDQLTSITGRQLYAKAALLNAPPVDRRAADPLRRHLEEHLDRDFAPIRALISDAPREVRGVLTLYYETCLQWPCVEELRGPVARSSVTLNDALKQVAVERMSRAPRAFVELAITDYRSLWAAFDQRHPTVAPALTAFVAANRPLPYEHETFKVDSDEPLVFRPSAAITYLQPAVIFVGWCTGGLALLALALAATRRLVAPAIAVACLASLTAHARLVFSALFAAGISRFTVSLWPAIMTAMVFGGWSLVRRDARA
jgi:hypothetical protein